MDQPNEGAELTPASLYVSTYGLLTEPSDGFFGALHVPRPENSVGVTPVFVFELGSSSWTPTDLQVRAFRERLGDFPWPLVVRRHIVAERARALADWVCADPVVKQELAKVLLKEPVPEAPKPAAPKTRPTAKSAKKRAKPAKKRKR